MKKSKLLRNAVTAIGDRPKSMSYGNPAILSSEDQAPDWDP